MHLSEFAAIDPIDTSLYGPYLCNLGNRRRFVPKQGEPHLYQPSDRAIVRISGSNIPIVQTTISNTLWDFTDNPRSVTSYAMLKDHPIYKQAGITLHADPSHDALMDNPLYGSF